MATRRRSPGDESVRRASASVPRASVYLASTVHGTVLASSAGMNKWDPLVQFPVSILLPIITTYNSSDSTRDRYAI